MEEGILPHSRTLDDPEELEEERRLAYVGITRAEEKLYLTRAKMRMLLGQTHTNPRPFPAGDPPGVGGAGRQAPGGFEEAGSAPRSRFVPSPTRETDWRVGDKVSHKKWGSALWSRLRGKVRIWS